VIDGHLHSFSRWRQVYIFKQPPVGATTGVDIFAALPPECPLATLEHLTDLTSLHSLRCASPTVASFLLHGQFTAGIVEKIMFASLSPVSQDLVCLCGRLLQGPGQPGFNIGSLDDLLDGLTKQTYYNDRTGYIIRPMPFGNSPAVILHILALSAVNNRIVHRSFHVTLDRALKSRPRRPVDREVS